MTKDKVVLNSSEIENFLKYSRELGDFLDFAAKPVEKSVKSQVARNNNKYGYKKDSEKKKENRNENFAWGQEVTSEKVVETDRQKVEVKINNAKFSDFAGNSIPKAVDKHKKKR